MKPAPGQAGYTIVETMIFLAISAALLVATVGMFSGRVQRTQFTQSAQAMATRIKTTANEVATGTYPDRPSFNCTISAVGNPTISSGGNAQGTRSDCIFVGKVMNFAVAGGDCADNIADHKCETVETYLVVGRREVDTATHQVVTTLLGSQGARPRIVTSPNVSQSFNIGYGTRVTAIYRKNPSGALDPISAVGFFQNFGGSYGGDGKLSSGSQNVSFWTVKSTTTPITPQTINDLNTTVTAENLDGPNPDGGVVICVKSGNDDQTASITLSTTNGMFTTDVKIDDSQCPA